MLICILNIDDNLIFTINELSKDDNKKSRKIVVASGDNFHPKPENGNEILDTSANDDT